MARKLVALSLDGDQQVSLERVRAVLHTLETRKPRQLKALLKEYYIMLRRELRQSEASVEHAGALPSATFEAIAQKLTAERGRKISVTEKTNPSLIAGVRVRVGDDVYEDSIATRLNTLAHAMHA